MSITRSVTRGVTRPVTRGIGEHFFGDSTEMTLRYDFANKPSLDALVGPTLTIARASTATVTDYDNVLRTVQAAEARFTGGRRVENVCTQSQTFNTTWTTTAATVATEATTDPDGGSTADSIDEDGSAATLHYIRNRLQGLIIGASYTVSVYAKKSNRDWINFQFAQTGANPEAWFDLTNGAVGTTSNTDATGIVDIGSGWYRCWINFVADKATNNDFYLIVGEADNDSTFDGLSQESIFVWGAQVENVSGQDDPSPSEYQATTTAAVAKWYATKRRTNEVLYSEDLSNAAWSVISGAKGTDSDITRYDGTTGTVGWINDDGAAANVRLQQQWRTDGTVGATYRISAYFKKRLANGNWAYMIAADDGIAAYFDLVNGVVGTEINSPAATIEDAGNGWYRCSIFTTATDTSPRVNFYSAEGDNDVGIASPDQTYSIYVDAVQAEQGSTATAYIATTTAIASSAVDTAITATGLLVEEARTNICLQSEDLSTTWLPISPALVTADQATAPDGTLTADKLGDDSSTGTGACRLAQNLTIATATTFTYSVYLKQDGLSWGNITILSLGALSIYAYFDLVNGVVGATTGANNTSEFIEDVGNGWYRCGIVFESDASDAAGSVNVYPADGNGDNVVDLDGTSSIFVWGAQLEAGAFPTSYIPTTTVSVTRAADDINTTDVGWLNANEGTLHVNATKKAVVSQVAAMVTINDGGATDQIFLDVASNDTRAAVTNSVGNGDLVVFTSNKWASNLTSDIAFAWAQDDVAVYQDGDAATPGTSVDLPLADAAIQLDVGQRDGDLFWNGHIAEIRYYNSRLDNAALLNMSNGIFP